MAVELWPIKVIRYTTIILAWNIQTVWSYYCEWDLCGNDQYCCGDNLCCEYVYSLWYFWVGILFVVILLSACGGLFRYCYYHSPQMIAHRITSYVPVPNIGASDDSDPFLVVDNEITSRSYSSQKPPGYFPPQGPPPPYCATVAHVKHNSDNSLSSYP